MYRINLKVIVSNILEYSHFKNYSGCFQCAEMLACHFSDPIWIALVIFLHKKDYFGWRKEKCVIWSYFNDFCGNTGDEFCWFSYNSGYLTVFWTAHKKLNKSGYLKIKTPSHVIVLHISPTCHNLTLHSLFFLNKILCRLFWVFNIFCKLPGFS